MGFGSSLKRIATGVSTGGLSEVANAFGGGGGVNVPMGDPYGDRLQFNNLGDNELAKRTQLGKDSRGKINTYADDQANRAAAYRASLAKSLSDTSANVFKNMNPGILEDLNSRGLFTSQTARDQEQGRLLSDLATKENQQLTDFDTQNYGDQNDLRSQGLNAELSGDQSGLDAQLGLQKAGLTRQFNVQDTNAENSFAADLAKRKSKDQLLQSLLGVGGQLAGAGIRGAA